jgi:DNA modification methylase
MSKLAYNPKYALNAICPYYTMFPLEYPLHILKKHKKQNPKVLDPFCGRGTTIYAARELGLTAWGIDTSPIAVSVAKAKLAKINSKNVLKLAKKLIEKEPVNIPDTLFFRSAFSASTLKQLCALREGLLNIKKETDASIILRASALGCLHGPLSKSLPEASYFSNQMPRTFSTKPDYSIKYWKEKGLKAPKVQVYDVLKRKMERFETVKNQFTGSPKHIICSDSSLSKTYKNIPTDISLIITSPPYYGMRTYIEDQWLRMWFLGGPEYVDYGIKEQISHSGQEAFITSLANVWQNIYHSESDKVHAYIRFGTISSYKSDAKKIILASFEEARNWKMVSIREADDAHAGKRQADQMVRDSKAALEYDFHFLRL